MALFLKKRRLSFGKSWGQLEVFGRFPGELEEILMLSASHHSIID